MDSEVSAVRSCSHFSESRAAEPDTVAWARQRVAAFAQAAGVIGKQLEDIRLLVSEAVTNAVMYAYEGLAGDGQIHVIAAVVADELWIVIADDGLGMRKRSSASEGLGLGLVLMAKLCDRLTVTERSGGGVEVRMQFQLDDRAQG